MKRILLAAVLTLVTALGVSAQSNEPKVIRGSDGTSVFDVGDSATGSVKMKCVSGCVAGGGVTDTDDNSIATGQVVGLGIGINYGYDGTAGVWKRFSLFGLAGANAQAVAIVDAAGAQISSFGGGTQYLNGAASGGPTGTLSLGFDGANLRALLTNASGHLNVIFPSAQPVNINDGSGNAIPSTTAVYTAGDRGLNVRPILEQRTSAAQTISAAQATINTPVANATAELVLDGQTGGSLVFPSGNNLVCIVGFDYSMDGSFWYPSLALDIVATSQKIGSFSMSSSSKVFQVLAPGGAKKVRTRCIVYTSGNAAVTGYANTEMDSFGLALAAQLNGTDLALIYPTMIGGAASIGTSQPKAQIMNVCDQQVVINQTSATTTQLVALSGTTRIRICAYEIAAIGAAGPPTWKFIDGTGAACVTAPSDITGVMSSTTTTTEISHFGQGNGLGEILRTRAGNALCITTTTTSPQRGWISYAQY